MLKIDPKFVIGLRKATDIKEVHFYLQKAIELEHSTIPPYLTAMYSLIPGKNDEIAALIRSVVIEEMMHMTISANILIATGGAPKINTAGFIPSYPGPLPMGIGDGLIVPIKAFSKELVKDVFMAIEEPENPIPITRGLTAVEEEWHTIGQFYKALQDKIEELGDKIFTVGPEKQVLDWFDPDENIPIVSAASAIKAIETIVEEGEGTSTSPFVPGESAGDEKAESPEVAHYYLFEEIYEGRKIEADGKGGYAFSGPKINFDKDGVYPMIDNPSQADYAPDSEVSMLSNSFSYGYSSLLNALHDSFNGNPKAMDTAIGLMYQLKLNAQKLMSMPVKPGSNKTAGPVFRYIASNPSK